MRLRAMKDDPHGAAGDRPPVRGEDDLELLRAVMRRAVILGGGEKRRVVAQPQALHERRDELVGRQAAKAAVFRRHDDVEAPRGACDEALLREAAQSELGRGGGHAERGPHVFRGEVIAAAGGKAGDEGSGFGHARFRIHAHKVS